MRGSGGCSRLQPAGSGGTHAATAVTFDQPPDIEVFLPQVLVFGPELHHRLAVQSTVMLVFAYLIRRQAGSGRRVGRPGGYLATDAILALVVLGPVEQVRVACCSVV